jgi:hypothetical protein
MNGTSPYAVYSRITLVQGSRLAPSEGPACRVRLSEGPACRVRRTMFDHPFRLDGHDRHAPPTPRRDALVASASRRDPLVASASRRDPLVGSAAPCLIIHFASTGMTGMPLRALQAPACQVRYVTRETRPKYLSATKILRFPMVFCEVAGCPPGRPLSSTDKIALNSRHLLELPSLPNYDRNGCLRY